MAQSNDWHAAARKLQATTKREHEQQSQAKSDHAAGIVAAAQRQAGRHQPKTQTKADDQDVIDSLKSIGAISSDQPDRSRADRSKELAGRVSLKGLEQETAKQKAASDREIVASLKSMGVIGDEEDGK